MNFIEKIMSIGTPATDAEPTTKAEPLTNETTENNKSVETNVGVADEHADAQAQEPKNYTQEEFEKALEDRKSGNPHFQKNSKSSLNNFLKMNKLHSLKLNSQNAI